MPALTLTATDLCLAFDGNRIIDLPALIIGPGKLTVLSGPSGSGKSTLLYLLSGLIRPDSGNVVWSGENLAMLSESGRDRWRRANAGFIFQNFHLIDELSPLENVFLPAWFSAFSAATQLGRARELLNALNVPARNNVALLSRGEQQRVAIARALIADPPVIFADEPTASLDARAAETVVATLVAQAHRDGRTVIVATHDPALKSVADSIIELDHGHAAHFSEVA